MDLNWHNWYQKETTTGHPLPTVSEKLREGRKQPEKARTNEQNKNEKDDKSLTKPSQKYHEPTKPWDLLTLDL